MKNRKGFVMTETLVVTVFLVTIFTFIYVSVVPLLGKYEELSYRNADIDIVYKLYNIRKMILSDENGATITSNTYKRITCEDLSDTEYCENMMDFLELNSYILAYVNNIQDRLINLSSLNEEMYEYASKYKKEKGAHLILLDQNAHTIAHLGYSAS